MPECATSTCRAPEKFSDFTAEQLTEKAKEKLGTVVNEVRPDGRPKFSTEALATLEEVSIPALDKLPTDVKNKLEDPANVKIVDDTTYVSKIQVCRQSADTEQITGVKITFKNAATGVETPGAIEGNAASECPTDKVIELEETDCITRLNIGFDDAGNGHSLIYRRREGTEEETMGLKSDFKASDVTNDDVPATGCLSGYNLGFGAKATAIPAVGASRVRLNAHPVVGSSFETLQGMVTISSGALDEQLAEEELEAVIVEEVVVIQQQVAAEEAAKAVT